MPVSAYLFNLFLQKFEKKNPVKLSDRVDEIMCKRKTACSCCPTKVCIDKMTSLICIHIDTIKYLHAMTND